MIIRNLDNQPENFARFTRVYLAIVLLWTNYSCYSEKINFALGNLELEDHFKKLFEVFLLCYFSSYVPKLVIGLHETEFDRITQRFFLLFGNWSKHQVCTILEAGMKSVKKKKRKEREG